MAVPVFSPIKDVVLHEVVVWESWCSFGRAVRSWPLSSWEICNVCRRSGRVRSCISRQRVPICLLSEFDVRVLREAVNGTIAVERLNLNLHNLSARIKSAHLPCRQRKASLVHCMVDRHCFQRSEHDLSPPWSPFLQLDLPQIDHHVVCAVVCVELAHGVVEA